MSYSLRDFLLFSADTWWVLYMEFTASHWIMAAVTAFLVLLTVLCNPNKCQKFQTVLLLTNTVLLVASTIFYLSFYLQINQFAVYLVALCLLQLGLMLFCHWRWRHLELLKTARTMVLRSHTTLIVWLFVISLGSFVVSPGFIQSEIDKSAWGLQFPGWSPLTSGLLLIFFARFYQGLSLLWLLPVILVVIAEMLTFYAMGMKFWWLAFFALVTVCFSKTD